MDTQIIVVYRLIDDILKALQHYEDDLAANEWRRSNDDCYRRYVVFQTQLLHGQPVFIRKQLHSKHVGQEPLQSPFA